MSAISTIVSADHCTKNDIELIYDSGDSVIEMELPQGFQFATYHNPDGQLTISMGTVRLPALTAFAMELFEENNIHQQQIPQGTVHWLIYYKNKPVYESQDEATENILKDILSVPPENSVEAFDIIPLTYEDLRCIKPKTLAENFRLFRQYGFRNPEYRTFKTIEDVPIHSPNLYINETMTLGFLSRIYITKIGD